MQDAGQVARSSSVSVRIGKPESLPFVTRLPSFTFVQAFKARSVFAIPSATDFTRKE